MEILCSLDNIQFPITKYEIKNKEIKLEILFDTNKYKGVFEQLEIKCIPLLFDKYKDTILQLKIYSDIYQVKCKDCEFFRPNIHTDERMGLFTPANREHILGHVLFLIFIQKL